MAISKYSTLFSHFHGSTTVLQSLATAINYQRICRLISTHANNHQLMWGQSTVIRVTFRVKNPPFFKAQNQKWKLWPQFHIFITYLMKSATSTKVSYINKMDMCPSNHKMNAINNLAIYTPQIISQTLGFHFISKFWRVFRSKLSPTIFVLMVGSTMNILKINCSILLILKKWTLHQSSWR